MVHLKKAIEEIQQEGFQKPSVEQIAQKMAVSPGRVIDLIEMASQTVVSLDSPVRKTDAEDGSTLEDLLPGDPNEVEDMIDNHLLSKQLEQVFEQLSPMEHQILKLRYGFGAEKAYTLDEIAAKLCISRETVRHIEGKALRAFRQPSIYSRLCAYI